MLILFSAVPARRHLLPLLPLARALRDGGHEVAVVTSGRLAPVIEAERFTMIPAGPNPDLIFAEMVGRRGESLAGDPSPTVARREILATAPSGRDVRELIWQRGTEAHQRGRFRPSPRPEPVS